MACSGYIRKKPSKVCAGSMDKLVQFFDRKTLPNTESFTINLVAKFSPWCSVETRIGSSVYNGTNVVRGADTTIFRTHNGYVFEKKMLAKLEGRYFEVDRFENLNEDNRFIEVTCIELGNAKDTDGTTDLETSWAKCE